MTPPIFNETQRFRQVWVWAILLSVTVAGIASVSYAVATQPNLSFVDVLVPMALLLLVNALFYSLKLTTRITESSLSFRFKPFLGNRIYRFEDLESMEITSYSGLKEFGGWGIKWNGSYWSYTTGGTHGILIKTKDKKLLLGTQKPEEAKQAIAQFNEQKSRYGR
jgi:hypothetical protein